MDIKVEIARYFPMKSGAVIGSFDMVIQPFGMKILGCKYFQGQNEARWFNYPSKEVKKEGEEKGEWIPYVSYVNKEFGEIVKNQALKALKEKEGGDNVDKKAQNAAYTGKNPAKVQSKPSAGW